MYEDLAAQFAHSMFQDEIEKRGDWDDLSLDDKAPEAMKFAVNGGYDFMTPVEGDRKFDIGIVILMASLTDEDEKARLKQEADFLKMLSAAGSGIPVDWSQIEDTHKPLGLSAIYRRVVRGDD